jgi:hypothetical protein
MLRYNGADMNNEIIGSDTRNTFTATENNAGANRIAATSHVGGGARGRIFGASAPRLQHFEDDLLSVGHDLPNSSMFEGEVLFRIIIFAHHGCGDDED